MSFKKPNDICIISNRKIIVSKSPLAKIVKNEESRKKNQIATAAKSKSKSAKRKDPTDALPDFIAELDIDSIERGIDFESLDSMLRRAVSENDYDLKSLVNEKLFCSLCYAYDYTVKELVKLLMEKYPANFDLKFVKTTVKPFIVKLLKAKLEYDNSNPRDNRLYKSIFRYL